jgi:hypothetical protein
MGQLNIKEVSAIEPLDIATVTGIEPLKITQVTGIEPLEIARVANVEPVAIHIKEVNHIDPLAIDSLHIDEVRNIDPIRVQEFNVTRLPTVNLAVRQIPPVDFNVRHMPPLSVSLGQDFCLPSNYTFRARLLGFEVLRVNVDGRTGILPEERARREQVRAHERSFPEVAAAGNPAIPSKSVEVRVDTLPTCAPCFALSPGGPRMPFGFAATAPDPGAGIDPLSSAPKARSN